MVAPDVESRSATAASNVHPLKAYFQKWKGKGEACLPRPPAFEMVVGWLGCFISILAIAALNRFASSRTGPVHPLIVASFGASAVLVFNIPDGKLSQPRNVAGGHFFSALTGCIVRLILPVDQIWVGSAIAMSLAAVVMQLTATTHPPAGATALMAASVHVLGPWKGFQILVVVLLDAAIMLTVGLVINNLSPKRSYPTFWF